MITDKKITAFTKTHVMLPDVPSPAMSALEIKQWWDSSSEEQRVKFNALIDALGATTTGDSGAEAIGVEPIVGIGATNVQNALEQLRVLINDAVAGAIPDGTITPVKLSFDPATQPELDAHAADNTHTRYAVATGAANTYAITLSPAPSAYVEGMSVRVKINVLNSAASTININGLGAKSIKKASGNDVLAGNLKVGIVYTLTYGGTNFILQGEGGEYGTAGAGQVVTGYTVGTDTGVVNGTFTSDATITAADILNSKVGYGANGARIVGSAVAGKKSANGQATSSATFTATEVASSSNAVNTSKITVTGLTFRPSVIYAFDGINLAIYCLAADKASGATQYTDTVKITEYGGAQVTVTVDNYKANAGAANVTNTGFVLPVSTSRASRVFEWYAFE